MYKMIINNMMKSFVVMGPMQYYKPYIAMVFVQVVYAGMALFSKAAIAKGMNPFVFVVYRQAFATLFLAPFTFFLERNKDCSLSYKLICKIFFISLCGVTLSLNLYYVAINYTTATFAAATTNTIPVITFLMALFFRMESVYLRKLHGIAKVLGSILCVSGALVFAFVKGPHVKFINWYSTTQNQNSESSSVLFKNHPLGEWIKGALVMLSANTAWSLWLILQTTVVKQYPAKLRFINLQCFFSCMQSAIWAVAVERNPSAWKLQWGLSLLSVAYCGIVVTGITYWLQVWAIEKKGPVFTATFTPLALIMTAIFSTFIWKETLYWGSVGGGVLLVGGLYGVLWGKNKEETGSSRKIQNQDTSSVLVECITHRS